MMNNHFADIILPLAVKGKFTYRIPEEFSEYVIPGIRVLVQFGKRKLYTGIVGLVHNEPPGTGNLRPILRVLDPAPVANETMLKFWTWMAAFITSPGVHI